MGLQWELLGAELFGKELLLSSPSLSAGDNSQTSSNVRDYRPVYFFLILY